MNKKNLLIIVLVIIVLIGIGVFFYVKNITFSPNEKNYEASKTSTNNTSNQTENQENVSTTNEIKQGITESENASSPVEEQIATFTTKIYSSDSARQNNISITCTALNGTIVKKDETFSFCNTIGPSSSSKGYQEADIYDRNGNKKKGLGGRELSN
jgi:vancomycin resistance protein YoaR